jgi:biofilm PGA synthesis N-glycosyltransferase PgaC
MGPSRILAVVILTGLPRYNDLEFRLFLRSYQHACLRLGKRVATAKITAERARL